MILAMPGQQGGRPPRRTLSETTAGLQVIGRLAERWRMRSAGPRGRRRLGARCLGGPREGGGTLERLGCRRMPRHSLVKLGRAWAAPSHTARTPHRGGLNCYRPCSRQGPAVLIKMSGKASPISSTRVDRGCRDHAVPARCIPGGPSDLLADPCFEPSPTPWCPFVVLRGPWWITLLGNRVPATASACRR